MNKNIYPIFHKNKKIWYSDWRNKRTESESLAVIEETTSFIEKMNEYNLLEIVDVTGSFSPPRILIALKDSGNRTKKYSKRKAIVGVTGAKMILLQAVNRFIDGNLKGFTSLDEAKEWIVRDKE
jgi:hypothetical protein